MKNTIILISLTLIYLQAYPQEFKVKPNTKITVVSGTTLKVVNGDLRLESDETGDTSLQQWGNITFNGNGKTIVERYLTAWTDDYHGWHFLSSPVVGQDIQPGFVSSPFAANEDFYKWDEASGLWINSKLEGPIWNPAFETTFGNGTGYMLAYGLTQINEFAGTLNTAGINKSGFT